MELIITTIGLGIIAKFVEMELDKATSSDTWIDLETLNKDAEAHRAYSLLESYQ